MLDRTFCHIRGIGPKAERKLWEDGFRTWQDALDAPSLPLSPNKSDALRRNVAESVYHAEKGNAAFFANALPTSESWRLFPAFRDRTAYIDIETTGLGGPSDYITTIALYDGRDLRYYLHGANLDDFSSDIKNYDLLISYNGKTFDVPFIREYLGAPMEHAHIDLRYVLASLGFKGGLKNCEKRLGLDRDELEGVDGFFAVLLWYDFYNKGNRKALETLIAYNMTDVVNLEHLMVMAFNLKVTTTPFADSLRIPSPNPPEIPFKADSETVERLRRKASFGRGW
ncbi:MAG: exonuclease [Lentisphaerae bacterium]|jgi:uncharacterized protein|nr:exonuclease [Lentisphaerota bacterium]MBT4816653.1 exonuclease [Lentisphaerota bacterium]MBT5610072.1 exonuclease [Lentisphaerota bacterium]MBT7055528.1 exonuclease [Lentisphaerota bacterium]MBT7841517.1 exonuclease [Lentisphaerota bacterium]